MWVLDTHTHKCTNAYMRTHIHTDTHRKGELLIGKREILHFKTTFLFQSEIS